MSQYTSLGLFADYSGTGVVDLNVLFQLLYDTGMLDPEAEPVTPAEKHAAISDRYDALAAEVSAVMDGYLRKRYLLPLTAPYPADLVKFCQELTLLECYRRRDLFREDKQRRYDAVLRWLRDVAAGTVDLGIDPQPTAAGEYLPEGFGDERVFTQAGLRGVL